MTLTLATLSGCHPPQQSELIKTSVAFDTLKGFDEQNFTAAALSFQHSCQRLVVAQDVGGAIKGALRGDFYCGSGLKAAEISGPLKVQASFYTLVPKA